ncbi:phosphotransferase [Natronohydrobacter thiooxidans]|uniref:phosphotransferase n=1 Tax=Natronohydrobacter thiooxidans TaxID=87172 RepID=UPI000AB8E452|nr:phosphotransferase [Natronohydrobacter thiooxidans]
MIGSFFSRGPHTPVRSSWREAGFDEAAFLEHGFGLKSGQVSRSEIKGGQASISLMQFSTEDGPFMIRKRIAGRKQSEIAFMKALQDPHDITKCALQVQWTLPKVFDIAETETHTDIYMEYVDGVIYPSTKLATTLVRPLAKAIYELSLVLPVICRSAEIELEHRGMPGGSFFSKIENLVNGSDSKLRDLVRLQRQLPVTISHNDIFWPNMGMTMQAEEPVFTFIDFGMLGQNVIGAELHHFARVAIGSQSKMEFFKRLSRHYARHVRMDPAVVEMNALFYAMMRLVAFDMAANEERVAGLCAGALKHYDALTGG